MDGVLRASADGLQFFAEFLPRAAFVAERAGTGDRLPTCAEIESRYYQQSDIRLDALAADIEVVTRGAADIERQCDDQERIRSEIAQAWQGQAADSAHSHLTEHLRRAAGLRQDLDDVRCALVEADRVLRDVAAGKAEWLASLDATRVCGRTVAEVDGIIETAATFGSAADDAATWAVEVFLARVRDTTAQFVDLCDAAESRVDDVFRNLDAAFCGIDDSAYPAPARLEQGCSGSLPVPAQTCPQAPAPAVTTPAAATPFAVTTPGSLTGLTATAAATAAPAASVAPAPVLPPNPPAPMPGIAIGPSGSLAIDGTVRALGAIVGAVAQIALDVVGDVVVEVTETVRQTGSLNLDSGGECECDCECSCETPAVAPPPEASAPPTEVPVPEPAPVPEPEPDPEPPSPEPDPEPPCPEPPTPVPVPEEVPEVPEPPADYCAPSDDADTDASPVPGASASNPVRGTKPSAAMDPTLAELGPQAPVAADPDVALAEMGAM